MSNTTGPQTTASKWPQSWPRSICIWTCRCDYGRHEHPYSNMNIPCHSITFWSIETIVSEVYLIYDGSLYVWLLNISAKWQLHKEAVCSLIVRDWQQNLTFTIDILNMEHFLLSLSSSCATDIPALPPRKEKNNTKSKPTGVMNSSL